MSVGCFKEPLYTGGIVWKQVLQQKKIQDAISITVEIEIWWKLKE